MDLFGSNVKKGTPLAERMRPVSLDNFVGQQHIVGADTLLRRAIKADVLGNCIFYGPPGTGKTTLAHIIASNTNSRFVKLNAVSSGVADAKKVIEDARQELKLYGKKTYLLLDECHRWSKAQSDCVLSAIEDGSIVFIGSTTENPNVAMTRAIVSRCRLFEFLPLSKFDIVKSLRAALAEDEVLLSMRVTAEGDAIDFLADVSSGDLRCALNALELAALSTEPDADGTVCIDKIIASQSIQKRPLSIDESLYYDLLSAFCKSLRGSDPNAALYYSNRWLSAGGDPMLIFRRLMIHASEDVGLSDSNALNIAVNACLSFERLGIPEGNIPLSHAIIYVCLAPKSNSVVAAMGAAIEDAVKFKDDAVPHYLRDRSYARSIDDGSSYIYPHDYGGYVEQQYLPDSLKDRVYYKPSDNGVEKKIKTYYYDLIKQKNKGE